MHACRCITDSSFSPRLEPWIAQISKTARGDMRDAISQQRDKNCSRKSFYSKKICDNMKGTNLKINLPSYRTPVQCHRPPDETISLGGGLDLSIEKKSHVGVAEPKRICRLVIANWPLKWRTRSRLTFPDSRRSVLAVLHLGQQRELLIHYHMQFAVTVQIGLPASTKKSGNTIFQRVFLRECNTECKSRSSTDGRGQRRPTTTLSARWASAFSVDYSGIPAFLLGLRPWWVQRERWVLFGRVAISASMWHLACRQPWRFSNGGGWNPLS